MEFALSAGTGFMAPDQDCQSSNRVGLLNLPRVLLADDHHELLKRVTSILSAEFDVVGSATNGHELVEQAHALQPDVVVVDISMPILNGIDAVRQLLASGSTAKFIFLTLHRDATFVQACFAAGAMAYVVKDRIPVDLVVAVQEVLAGRQYLSPPLSR
jgi:DNA-binding NarL/FixJ family response regulator